LERLAEWITGNPEVIRASIGLVPTNAPVFDGVKGVVVPTAVSVFPDELYPAPRSWAEQAYPKLFTFNRADDDAGGQEG